MKRIKVGPQVRDEMHVRTVAAFEAWLNRAQPGDWIGYHVGGSLTACEEGLVRLVQRLIERGLIVTAQRRESKGEGTENSGSAFAYLACRTVRPA